MSQHLALSLPRDVAPDAFETLLVAAHAILARGGGLRRPDRMAIELAADATGIGIRFWTAREETARALRDATTVLLSGGQVVMDEASGHETATLRRLSRVRLGRSEAPLRTDLSAAGLAALLAPVTRLRGDDRALVQFLLVPAVGAPRGLLRRAANAEQAGRRGSWAATLVAAQVNRHRAGAIRDKAAAPLFRVTTTIASTSGRVVADLAAGFGQFSGTSSPVRRRRVWWPARVRRQVTRRRFPIWPAPGLVNTVELGALLSPTPAALRALRGPVASSRRLPAPAAASRHGRVLCVSNERGRTRPVALRPADARLHSFLVGPTGVGKSTLMGNLVLQAITAGDGAIVLDPKGDLVDDLLSRLPERRAGDLILIDPVRDRDHPVGLNLLERTGGQDAATVTEAIVATMRDLYARNWGARTDDTLYNGLFTAAGVPGTTLADLPRLFASPAARRPYLAALRDPFVRDFWRFFDGLSPGERAAILAPVLNKLRPLLRPDLAPIIGQRRSTVDLAEVLARQRILLVRLPRDGALFGALLVARLWHAASRRVAIPVEQRPDVLLAIDEVHAFLRTGGDVADMLAMARGLRLSLCLATQHLEQCPPGLRAALLANARTRVCFQADAADAAALARGFAPELEAADLVRLGRYEIACRMAIDGAVSRPFTGRTLPLPDPVRSSPEPLRAGSRARYGRSRRAVEDELRDRHVAPAGDLEAATIGHLPPPTEAADG